MTFLQLIVRNIMGSAFRSWAVVLSAFLIAGFTTGALLIMRGAEQSLQKVSDRLGADLLVLPEGSLPRVEGALLMGRPTEAWMDYNILNQVRTIPGVEVATPQLYLSTLSNASCCSVPEMFLVAYDPESDFTIQPWLVETLGEGLKLGEAVGGTYISIPEGEQNILLYGYFITLKANMEPTGTGLDQSMFLTFETAYDIARISTSMAERPLKIPSNSISAVMVRLEPDADADGVALEIMRKIEGVTPVQAPDMFLSYRQHITGLLRSVSVLITLTMGLSVLLITLIFSMAANERRRELGVLRALGAPREFLFQTLLSEAGLLALAGGASGIAFTVFVVYLFRNLIIRTLNIPFMLPSPLSLALMVLGGLLLSLLSVTLAAIIPAYRASHQEPALAMRE